MKKTLSLALSLLMLCSVLCAPAMAAPAYTAGTYTATVDGHNGPLTVEVTFTDAAIDSVAVTEHAETAGIADSALANVPAAIVAGQTLNVDTISGATVTSKAIIAGVTACVEQAGANPADLQTAAAVVEKNLTAGTYTAAKHGHHSDVTVEVVLTADAIESVKVVDSWESYNIGDLAIAEIPAAIVANQSIGVDAVTGATYTSRAILSAVEDCLVQAGGQEAALAFGTKVEAEPWSTEEIEETYDVVVVGSGLSGMAAAMAAQDEGAKVALLEKLPYWGGTSQTTAGYLAFTGDEGQNKSDVYNYLMQRYIGHRQGDTYMGGDYPHPASVQKMADESYNTIKWLEETGIPFGYWESTGNRYGVVKEDGSVEDAFAKFMMVYYAEDDRDPNIAAKGMARMVEHFEKDGGKLYLNTTAESLVTDETGAVVGVKATGKGGKYTFNAKSVVLCAGGFGASEEMVELLAPAYVGEHNITLSGNTGDGIRMAMEIGAAVYEDQFMMGGSAHTILSDEDMIAEYKDFVTPKTAVYVTPKGLRVNSENPDTYSNSTMHVNPDSRDYYWVIINEAVAQAHEVPSGAFIPAKEVGTYKDLMESEMAAGNDRFFKADTLGELAKQIKIVPSTLMYTMNRYNELCAKGEDTDLFKPTDYLVAMEEGPFYAVKAYMSYFGTVGGVVTDENAAVLKADGTAIAGLYAAGENSNHNLFNNAYAGAWSLGECATFGRIAGINAAQAALK